MRDADRALKPILAQHKFDPAPTLIGPPIVHKGAAVANNVAPAGPAVCVSVLISLLLFFNKIIKCIIIILCYGSFVKQRRTYLIRFLIGVGVVLLVFCFVLLIFSRDFVVLALRIYVGVGKNVANFVKEACVVFNVVHIDYCIMF